MVDFATEAGPAPAVRNISFPLLRGSLFGLARACGAQSLAGPEGIPLDTFIK